MADKKEDILQAALELFAEEGYNAIATSKIAKRAEVSEGLIFRHFTSKKGLLDAIMKNAELRLMQLMAPIIFENDPKAVIRQFVELPFTVKQQDYHFWKLQFKLKWEPEYNNPQKMKPLLDKLTWAFSELQYPEPEQEAQLLSQIIDSISIEILRDGIDSQKKAKAFLWNKYNV